MGTKFSLIETVLIEKPVEEVFAFAADVRNDPRWRQGVLEMVIEPKDCFGAGSRTKEVMRQYGRLVKTEAEITAFEPNRRSAFRSITGPMPVSGSRLFEGRGGQTMFTYFIEGELDALFSLLWPLVRGSYRRQIAGDLQRLKRALE